MKSLFSTLSAACVLTLALYGTASASGPGPASSEYTRNQNQPPAKVGTSAERKAARMERRADTKAQAKAGEVPQVGENWGMGKNNSPSPVPGTHESRSAERKEKRAEIKQVVKSGEMPVTNEADVARVKKNP